MKKTFLLFAALYFSLSFGEGWGEAAFAQNLVPNPSFEDTVNCPQFIGQFKAAQWYVVEQTPDYYNACCTNPNQCSVPQNFATYRNAATGVAYCGLINYINYIFWHEKIGVKLIDTLKVGKKYNLSFKVSAVSSSSFPSDCATNKVGFLFSTIKYDLAHQSPTKNYCQFKADSLLKDTIGWELIKGSFIADSAYSYLTIGKFYTDSLVDTLRFFTINGAQTLMRSYCFIDDVYVGYDSTQDIGINNISEANINVYPNPVSKLLTIQTNNTPIESVQLINAYGIAMIRQDNMVVSPKIQLDVSNYPSGFYMLQIKTNQQILTKKINIIHN